MWRLLATALAVASFVVGCADGVVAPPSATRGISPSSPVPPPSIVTESSPTHEPIGLMPDDCEPGPEPAPVSDHVADGIGGDPVWAIGFGPAATLSFIPSDRYDDHGWLRKVLWLLRRSAPDPVTVTGLRVDDGSPLLFEYQQPGPQESVLVLDPDAPHGRHGDWYEYRGSFVVPSAGCYGLTAAWPGGGWELRFRAGLDQTASH